MKTIAEILGSKTDGAAIRNIKCSGERAAVVAQRPRAGRDTGKTVKVEAIQTKAGNFMTAHCAGAPEASKLDQKIAANYDDSGRATKAAEQPPMVTVSKLPAAEDSGGRPLARRRQLFGCAHQFCRHRPIYICKCSQIITTIIYFHVTTTVLFVFYF